jgi:hypothetical protein
MVETDRRVIIKVVLMIFGILVFVGGLARRVILEQRSQEAKKNAWENVRKMG